MSCKTCKSIRAKIKRLWFRFTGAEQAYKKMREMAWTDRQDLCQTVNQLESTVTDLRRATKQRNLELQADIDRARGRTIELSEEKIKVQRENLMDARREIADLKGIVERVSDDLVFAQNRLERLERPSPSKIGS